MKNELERSRSQAINIKSSSDKNEKHAIVIGGGIGGLLAARVLADFFGRVTLIERDHYPSTPSPRSGAPQGYHFHILLQRGFMIASKLFPTLADDLKAQGAFFVTPTTPPLLSVTPHGRIAHGPIDQEIIFAERPVIEWCIYRQLIRRPEIHVRSGWEVTGLIAAPQDQAPTRVTGVSMRERGSESHIENLNADLVVDASGRNSPLLGWLQTLNIELPPEEHVDSGLGYATRLYKKPENFTAPWHTMRVIRDAPNNSRAGLIATVRPGIWQVTLDGIAGLIYPPTDEAGFQQWLHNLAKPDLYNILQEAEPISPIRGFRTPVSYLRHFDQVSNLLRGFICTGDALCSFNPIYGQGMSAAAIEAEVLQTCLQANNEQEFEQNFYKQAIQGIKSAWWWGVIDDLRWPTVTHSGLQEIGDVLMAHRYLYELEKCMVHDQEIVSTFALVQGMVEPLQALFTPEIAAKVLRKAFPFMSKEDVREIAIAN